MIEDLYLVGFLFGVAMQAGAEVLLVFMPPVAAAIMLEIGLASGT